MCGEPILIPKIQDLAGMVLLEKAVQSNEPFQSHLLGWIDEETIVNSWILVAKQLIAWRPILFVDGVFPFRCNCYFDIGIADWNQSSYRLQLRYIILKVYYKILDLFGVRLQIFVAGIHQER